MKNKSELTVIIFLFIVNSIIAQEGVGINTTGNSADNSAILDVSSTDKGALIPRMTEAQRNSISSPADALMIYNTTTRCFNTYVHNAWFELCPECMAPSSVSAFTMTSDSVEAGEAVNFTASDFSGDYYFWTFAGATPGYDAGNKTPWSIKFNSPPGWKNIWLTVTKNGCKSTTRDSIYVKPVYNCTQTEQIFVVPAGITVITIEAWGGSGSSGGSGTGGKGGHVTGDLAVNPGDTLYVYVGGGGGWMYGNGYNGGGNGNGGGASDVRYGGNTLYDRVIVAGGGGGGGYVAGINGGDAGGLLGGDGMDYYSGGFPPYTQIGGTGGTQAAGGLGGWGSGYSGQGGPGNDGAFGIGGDWGCVGGSWAGAGGGGYYGGGAGGCGDHNSYGASGGGGSSYTGGVTNPTMYPATNTGNGKVIITW